MDALRQIFDAVILWTAAAAVIAMGVILIAAAWFALADLGEFIFGGKARRAEFREIIRDCRE